MRERGVNGMMGMKRLKERCKDRNSWRLFCRGHPLEGDTPQGRGVSYVDIDVYKPVYVDLSIC